MYKPALLSLQALVWRFLVLWTLLSFATIGAQSIYPELPLSLHLAKEAELAAQKNRPLVVLVSLPGCVYCRIAREHHLYPLYREGKISVVQVDMNGQQVLHDFLGQAKSHAEQVRAWRTKVTPTVYFFGPDGQHLAPALEGGSLPDFYAAYLQDRIQEATLKLRQ